MVDVIGMAMILLAVLLISLKGFHDSKRKRHLVKIKTYHIFS